MVTAAAAESKSFSFSFFTQKVYKLGEERRDCGAYSNLIYVECLLLLCLCVCVWVMDAGPGTSSFFLLGL